MHEKARHEVESETSKRKRGRPAKNSEKEKEYTDEEIFKLIDLWETMSAYITPNHQHTSTKTNEAMLLISLFKHSKTQRSHQQKVRCSLKSLDGEIIMEGRTTK